MTLTVSRLDFLLISSENLTDDSGDDFSPSSLPVAPGQGGGSQSSEVQSALRTLGSKVEDLSTCNDLISKHGSALQRSEYHHHHQQLHMFLQFLKTEMVHLAKVFAHYLTYYFTLCKVLAQFALLFMLSDPHISGLYQNWTVCV